MAVDLSKEQALDADLRAIQQVNFTENLNLAWNRVMISITEQVKENHFELFTTSSKCITNVFYKFILVWCNLIIKIA